MLADLDPGPTSSDPVGFTLFLAGPAGPVVLFSAYHPTVGQEPWSVDFASLGGSAAEPIGLGCAAGALPTLAAVGRAGVGDASFAVELRDAPALAITGLLVAFQPSDLVIGTCHWRVGAPAVALGGTADAAGVTRFGLGVPNDPALAGLRFFVQGIVPGTGGALLGLADLSAGLGVVIGP